MNHFELFGLSNQFELEGGLLSEQYRELQRRFHPDKFATASERDRLLAIQKSAQINDAYQTLKNPISRAEYILSESGLDIRGEQKTLQDMTFLMQQMELRETLEEIPSSSDPELALASFESDILVMFKDRLKQLSSELNQKQLEAAADSVRKLRFVVKLQHEIEQLEETLFE
ncbi:MAG: co-chaperone HscB [Aliivibrio sp.]|uniref:co-chaperone HscB n=1 Tax=Aliivibrio sp. TaxID=1872443 RepID=UPI001A3CBE67|nr:co-chaperone HscB [Aliivibrio sp.]